MSDELFSHRDVIVIGAGVIGVACADALAGRGVRVTVIDKRAIGHGCSFGNAGWLTPCFALPLAMPGMLLKSIGWMLDPNGPLYIRPDFSWDFARWLSRFALSMRTPLMHRSVAALVPMAKRSLELFRELDAEQPGAFQFAQKGLLSVAQSKAGQKAALQQMELVGRYGVRGKVLDAAGVRDLEPAITGPIVGGVYSPDEAHCEPLMAVQSLANRAQRNGASFHSGVEAYDFDRCGNRITGIHTSKGRLSADCYVVATGAWSAGIGRQLGVRIPIRSGKGYSITVERFEPAPRIPLMLVEKKCAITPRQSGVKIAGTLELVGVDESITPSRVRAILDHSRQYLNVPAEPKEIEVWGGLRPCTPDGVPIIGRPKGINNLVIATGHQLLGLELAPATGAAVADLIVSADPQMNMTPFDPARF